MKCWVRKTSSGYRTYASGHRFDALNDVIYYTDPARALACCEKNEEVMECNLVLEEVCNVKAS